APAHVRLAGIAFGEGFLDRGAGIDDGERDIRLALADIDAAGNPAGGAAEEAAGHAAEHAAKAAAAGIGIGGDDVRLDEIVGRADLAEPDILAVLQFALFFQRALHRAALHRAAAIDESEAARTLHEAAQNGFGDGELVNEPH